MKHTHFFLGANSAEGFYGLYEQLLDAKLYDLIILKGGPGCGKSTFMKKIGKAAEESGLDVEYVLCSSDPDSLDGVLVPQWHVGYADGTAPHVLDVSFPAAAGAYLDLGQFYDIDAIRPELPRLRALTEKNQALYREAYRALREAKAVHDEIEAVYNPHVDFAAVNALAQAHIERLKKQKCGL